MLHHSHCLAPQGASQILAQKFNTRNMHIFHCSAPCTPLQQREVAAKPSPRVLRAPSRRTTNKPRRRAPLVPLPWPGASFCFSNNAGDTRIRASLPMGACSGHYCSSRSCHQLSVWPSNDIDTCTSVSGADAISGPGSGRQIRPVTECGSACAILQARCLRA